MIKQADVFSDHWCDFIFEQRNKAYGAYELRKRYPDNLGIALLISVAIFGGVLSAPTVYGYFTINNGEPIVIKDDGIIFCPMMPPDEVEVIIPPKPLEVQPPLNDVIENRPPVIVDHVDDVQTLPTDDILVNADPGPVTVDAPGTNTGPDPTTTTTSVMNVVAPVDPGPSFFTIVEQMPEYPGGEKEMLKFINSGIKYPRQAIDIGSTGIAYISFIINKEGKVDDVKVERGFDKLCEQEAMRVIQLMPAWKPGKQNGKAVNVKFTVPVRFQLN